MIMRADGGLLRGLLGAIGRKGVSYRHFYGPFVSGGVCFMGPGFCMWYIIGVCIGVQIRAHTKGS